MNKTIEEKIVKGLIVYALLIAVIFALSSCGSTQYGICPAYSNYNANTTVNG